MIQEDARDTGTAMKAGDEHAAKLTKDESDALLRKALWHIMAFRKAGSMVSEERAIEIACATVACEFGMNMRSASYRDASAARDFTNNT